MGAGGAGAGAGAAWKEEGSLARGDTWPPDSSLVLSVLPPGHRDMAPAFHDDVLMFYWQRHLSLWGSLLVSF